MAIQELTATKRVYNTLSQQHCYIHTSHTYTYVYIYNIQVITIDPLSTQVLIVLKMYKKEMPSYTCKYQMYNMCQCNCII